MVPVYILAGGRSARFGSDKARALLNGEPLLTHVSRGFALWASRLTVVADVEGKYEDLGFRTIADRRPGMGPLGGLQRALEDLEDQQEEEWLLLTSCDLLGLRSAWINLLLSYRNESDTSIAFRGKQRWEPLPGLYRAWIHQQVKTQLDRRILPLWRLLEGSTSIPVPLPEGWDKVVHVNQVQDLASFESKA